MNSPIAEETLGSLRELYSELVVTRAHTEAELRSLNVKVAAVVGMFNQYGIEPPPVAYHKPRVQTKHVGTVHAHIDLVLLNGPRKVCDLRTAIEQTVGRRYGISTLYKAMNDNRERYQQLRGGMWGLSPMKFPDVAITDQQPTTDVVERNNGPTEVAESD